MQEADWLERAIEAFDVSLVLVSAERRIVFANAAAHRLFGSDPSGLHSLHGSSLERLVAPERRGELKNFEDVLAGGGARRVRSIVRREDGQRVEVTMALEPCFDEHGAVTGVSVRYYDPPQQSLRPPAQSRPPLGMGSPLTRPSPPPPHTESPGTEPRRPPSVRSESRLSPTRVPHEILRARLNKVRENLDWLEERLSLPPSVAPLDESRERARAIFALEEARGLVVESLSVLEGEEQVPPAPRVPRM